MNVDSSMCASSGQAAHWDQIDWPKCERQVRRLQARIVKATREGRWNKVKALQRLLTHAFSGKALAVKRVTENHAADTGQRTPEGQAVWVKLVYASDTKIKRHIKIRQEANPFDSQWRSYFQERAFYKKFGIHRRQAGIKPS